MDQAAAWRTVQTLEATTPNTMVVANQFCVWNEPVLGTVHGLHEPVSLNAPRSSFI
jgi:hypothetical protein